jgi:hypothetical protein
MLINSDLPGVTLAKDAPVRPMRWGCLCLCGGGGGGEGGEGPPPYLGFLIGLNCMCHR